MSKEPEKKDVWEQFDEKFTDNFVWWKECAAEALVGDVDVHALKSFINTHFIPRSEVVEWAKENAMPKDAGWEDSQKTIKLSDLLNLLTQQQ